MRGIEVVGEMPVPERRAIQTWCKEERASCSARVKDDNHIAACIALNCAFNVIGEQSEGGEAVECVGRQIAVEAFVNRYKHANGIEGVATQVSEAVFVRDVRTLQDNLPDIS